jgi:hypothetical protein
LLAGDSKKEKGLMNEFSGAEHRDEAMLMLALSDQALESSEAFEEAPAPRRLVSLFGLGLFLSSVYCARAARAVVR